MVYRFNRYYGLWLICLYTMENMDYGYLYYGLWLIYLVLSSPNLWLIVDIHGFFLNPSFMVDILIYLWFSTSILWLQYQVGERRTFKETSQGGRNSYKWMENIGFNILEDIRNILSNKWMIGRDWKILEWFLDEIAMNDGFFMGLKHRNHRDWATWWFLTTVNGKL